MSCETGEKVLRWKVKYYADSAEFCPVDPHKDIFVVGTYQLVEGSSSAEATDGQSGGEKSPQSRQGCLYLHRLSDNNKTDLQEIEVAGILDMKWSCQRVAGQILLGIVTSIGELLIYKIVYENGDPQLQLLCKTALNEANCLALSLDWSNRKEETSNPVISVSDSHGQVNVFLLSNDGLSLQSKHRCHDFECWITAFNYWNCDILYSGGDDGKFRGYDLRMGLETPIFTSKVHEAGTTSCHSNALCQYQFASGSYDEVVRIWDERQRVRPVAEERVGGGVWRLKWHPTNAGKLLAACMYNNFQVLSVSENSAEAVVSGVYREHESIAYGADWCWSDQFPHTLIAASFYDNTVSLWTLGGQSHTSS